MRPFLQHSEGRTFFFLLFIVAWLVWSIGFTAWWTQYQFRCGIITFLGVLMLRSIAGGPSASRLPENAASPRDFKNRPLNARPWAGKVAVVTGVAIGGMGHETVKSLSFLGAHVVMVDMLDEQQMERVVNAIKADDKHASLATVRLDLSKLDDIASAAWEIVKAACNLRGMPLPTKRLAEHPCIDFLVNNAGLADPKHRFVNNGDDKRLCLSFVVNHLGPYLLTEWLLPYIVNNTGRIVSLASVAHTWWTNFPTSLNPQARVIRMLEDVNDEQLVVFGHRDGYCSSKFCNLVSMATLARRLASRGIVCASVHPGGVASQIWNNVFTGVSKIIWDGLTSLIFKDVVQGHQTALHCLTAGNIISGQFYADCHAFRPRDEARDEKTQEAVEAWTRKQVEKWLPK